MFLLSEPFCGIWLLTPYCFLLDSWYLVSGTWSHTIFRDFTLPRSTKTRPIEDIVAAVFLRLGVPNDCQLVGKAQTAGQWVKTWCTWCPGIAAADARGDSTQQTLEARHYTHDQSYLKSHRSFGDAYTTSHEGMKLPLTNHNQATTLGHRQQPKVNHDTKHTLREILQWRPPARLVTHNVFTPHAIGYWHAWSGWQRRTRKWHSLPTDLVARTHN